MTPDSTIPDPAAREKEQILTALADGQLSASQITDRTGIAKTILSRLLNELTTAGKIHKRDAEATPGRAGRRPALWDLAPTDDPGTALAADATPPPATPPPDTQPNNTSPDTPSNPATVPPDPAPPTDDTATDDTPTLEPDASVRPTVPDPDRDAATPTPEPDDSADPTGRPHPDGPYTQNLDPAADSDPAPAADSDPHPSPDPDDPAGPTGDEQPASTDPASALPPEQTDESTGSTETAGGGVVCAALSCPVAACPARTRPAAPAPPGRRRARATASKINASGTTRLAPGQLGQLVAGLLRDHPQAQLTAGDIARELGRSSGAVAAALPRLLADGQAVAVNPGSRPARYQTAPAAGEVTGS